MSQAFPFFGLFTFWRPSQPFSWQFWAQLWYFCQKPCRESLFWLLGPNQQLSLRLKLFRPRSSLASRAQLAERHLGAKSYDRFQSDFQCRGAVSALSPSCTARSLCRPFRPCVVLCARQTMLFPVQHSCACSFPKEIHLLFKRRKPPLGSQ